MGSCSDYASIKTASTASDAQTFGRGSISFIESRRFPLAHNNKQKFANRKENPQEADRS